MVRRGAGQKSDAECACLGRPRLVVVQGLGRSPTVWHEFCVRHGRSMSRAGIGRRSNWGSEYSLSVEVFDRKGGFRLFCSYGRLTITSQVRMTRGTAPPASGLAC